jgi:hypothetical protein
MCMAKGLFYLEAPGQRRAPLVMLQHHGPLHSLPEASIGRHNGFLSMIVGISASTGRLAIIGVLFSGIRINLAQGTGDVVKVDREPPF